MNTLIIYHADCTDGFAAAWVAQRAIGAQGVSSTLIPAAYGQEPPLSLIEGATVYVLDFSYPRPAMEAIIQRAHYLVCLDHHATAEAALADLSGCFFSREDSGAMMTWRFFNDSPAPALIHRVSDNDTGKRALPDALEFSALIGSYPYELKAYDELNERLSPLNETGGRRPLSSSDLIATGKVISGDKLFQATQDRLAYSQLVLEGMAIRRELKKRAAATAALARPMLLDGAVALVANCSDRAMFSSVGVELAMKAAGGIGGCYYIRQDGQVEFSLRSLKQEQADTVERPSVDVSAVCRVYGGGGHKHAAGFVCSIDWLDFMMKAMK